LFNLLLFDKISQLYFQIMYGNSKSFKHNTLVICTPVYLIALGIAIAVSFILRSQHTLLIVGIADIAATVIVFLASVIFNNSSIYDPYWSIAPVPIAIYFILNPLSFNTGIIRQIIVFSLLLIWAVRLTYNCFSRWTDIRHEDWRYADIRKNTGRLYWPISLLGFHLFPTIIVFAGCLSLYPILSAGINQFGILDIIAILVTAGAIFIEARADYELKRFISKPENKGKIIDTGIWSHSRHPNYLGEVLFWWGLYFFALAANINYWWAIIGPVIITLLFVFISVPMMDRHILRKRQDYIKNMENIPALIPWFSRGK
jgi:steroid 5-alpha reductase family enzyme